mgnify:CR=1 FL=1
MPFAYEAIDRTGREINAVIEAESTDEAMAQLHARGLFVVQVSPIKQEDPRNRTAFVKSLLRGRPGNVRDRLLLTQQMSMMLHAGSQVVPALTAIQSQIDKPAWRNVVARVCQKVRDGSALSAAMADYPTIFDETFRAIVAAGETTGSTAQAFDRLAAMTKTEQEIKVRVIGAIIYPMALLLMAIGVVGVLMFFVLPKFADLYATLGTRLPFVTTVMIGVSQHAVEHKVVWGAVVLALLGGPIAAWRLAPTRRVLDRLVVGLPLFSRVVQRVILARIFRVWGTLVRSDVPLLESLRLSRNATKNSQFLAAMDEVIRSVEEGHSVGDSLGKQPLVPATMASAIATGEQSGQLGESLLFLAEYLDRENAETITALTRLLEPVILILMGLVVGGVAVSLFLPLFDLTSAVSRH